MWHSIHWWLQLSILWLHVALCKLWRLTCLARVQANASQRE
jgi:hypothetical protein